jgi:integrase
MPVQDFTDRGVRALPIPTSGQVDYFDAGRKPAGFGVRISYKGTRAWIFIYRYNGVKRRMKLGLVDEIGLKGARDLAWDAHAKARRGLDPASERKKLTKRAETVAELARCYIEEYAKPKKRSWKKDEGNLERDVIPQIGRKRLADVTRQDIRDLLRPILERGAPVQANRTLEVVRKMLNWAIQEKDLLAVNPAALVTKQTESGGRSRFLREAEYKRFWAALDPEVLGHAGAVAFKILALTAQREMELLRTRWSDIDLDSQTWIIPADNAKNQREHLVPLPPLTLALFLELHRMKGERHDFVFESPVKPGSHVRRVFIEKRIIKIRKAAGLYDVTVHDLRRSATTYWGKLRVDQLLKKRLLNHSRRGDVTSAVYDRFEYLDEKRDALRRWEVLLLDMVGGMLDPVEATASNVVPLARA